MKTKTKFQKGDSVRIVKYGSLLMESKTIDFKRPQSNVVHENKKYRWVDVNPELLGQKGIVSEVSTSQGKTSYAIEGIKGKYAWYDEQQLEAVKTKKAFKKIKTLDDACQIMGVDINKLNKTRPKKFRPC